MMTKQQQEGLEGVYFLCGDAWSNLEHGKERICSYLPIKDANTICQQMYDIQQQILDVKSLLEDKILSLESTHEGS